LVPIFVTNGRYVNAVPTKGMSHHMNQSQPHTPAPSTFTSAPLRNHLCVELNASPSAVWALVGHFERYPEYAGGIERVEVTSDSAGRCSAYVCHFKPMQPGGPSFAHREHVRWYETDQGYASMAAEPNDFGLQRCLTLVTLRATDDGTVLTWVEHFDAIDLAMHQTAFDQALADIGARLVERFGGRVAERYAPNPGPTQL
jgi:hypothetical protein